MKLPVTHYHLPGRYIQETGSDKIDDLLQYTSSLALSIILVPEIISALNRRLRKGFITDNNYREAKKQLLYDVRDATVIQLTPAVLSHSIKLLENNLLRAMDALHIACALEWKADLFVTSDKRQFKAAKKSGLQALCIGQPND